MLPTSFAYFGLSNVLALLNDVVIVGPNETIDGPNVANGSTENEATDEANVNVTIEDVCLPR